MRSTAIVWFRQDLRLEDNPALQWVVQRNAYLIPLYIFAPDEEGSWAPGSATKWWLHQSLTSLDEDLRLLGSKLMLRGGTSIEVLRTIIKETSANLVVWNRRYEPACVTRDQLLANLLIEDGIEIQTFNASLLFEPWTIKNREGKPFRVFTPFWKTCLSHAEPNAPLPKPEALSNPSKWPQTLGLEELQLEPTINWVSGIARAWQPGATGAHQKLDRLIDNVLEQYEVGRNRPDQQGVSRMSPHLHFGEISPRQIWQRVMDRLRTGGGAALRSNAQVYLKELGWREFGYHLLYHFPTSQDAPLYSQYAKFPWRQDAASLKRWQRGLTGYPLVDAGMRELWHTGWMHNRVRMVVGSFLVKDLLLPWQLGARWFWDTLVDADLASNTLGWQWVAGCGADAAPYYRVFNPVLQGKKFDPAGDYVRQWVPELAAIKGAIIHEPWLLSADDLKQCGVVLGMNYPERIVDHAMARQRALVALQAIKEDTIHK